MVTEPVIKCWYAVPYEIKNCNNVILDLGRSNKRKYFPGPTGMVQRLLLLTRPGLATTQWVTYQRNLCWSWKWAFPAPRATVTVKCPQNMVKYDYEGALLTGSWPLPAASTKIRSWPLQDADLQHPLERSSGWGQKIRHSVLWGKPRKNRPSDSQIFSGKDTYESKFLHLLIPREALMSRTSVWTYFS